jgi:hypothetical protein
MFLIKENRLEEDVGEFGFKWLNKPFVKCKLKFKGLI